MNLFNLNYIMQLMFIVYDESYMETDHAANRHVTLLKHFLTYSRMLT